MGSAAEVIALSEVRASFQWQRLRDHLHARFDQWLDDLQAQLPDLQGPLAEVTEAVWKVRHDLTGSICEAMVQEGHADESRRQFASCPDCGRRVKARPSVVRTVDTLVGAMRVKRPDFSWTAGGGGLYPMENA
jgi:DNA-directed RNA polymerase subunit RPC12/RpoP